MQQVRLVRRYSADRRSGRNIMQVRTVRRLMSDRPKGESEGRLLDGLRKRLQRLFLRVVWLDTKAVPVVCSDGFKLRTTRVWMYLG